MFFFGYFFFLVSVFFLFSWCWQEIGFWRTRNHLCFTTRLLTSLVVGLKTIFTLLFDKKILPWRFSRFFMFRFLRSTLLVGLVGCSIFLWFLLLSVKNFVYFFAVFELLSAIPPLFIIVGSRRLSIFLHETAIKYVFYNLVVTVLMLFGICFFYVLTGSLNLFIISTVISVEGGSFGFRLFFFTIALIFFFSPFFFKLGLVPFHWLVSDIYRALPLFYLIIYSTFFKFGLLVVFIQLFAICFWMLAPYLAFFFFSIFCGTLCVVSLQIFFLTNLRALFGYLSSLTVALLLLPFTAGSCGVSSGFILLEGIFFLSGFVVYCIGLFIFFYVLALAGYFSRKAVWELTDLTVIATDDVFLFFFFRLYLAVLLFIIVGLPPTYLFWFKFFFIESIILFTGSAVFVTVFFFCVCTVVFMFAYYRLLTFLFSGFAFQSLRLVARFFFLQSRRNPAVLVSDTCFRGVFFVLLRTLSVILLFFCTLNFFFLDFLQFSFFYFVVCLFTAWV